MFQREFALRLLARPGSALWCRLSANVQLYAKVDHIMKVSKNSFRPPPQVESSVVRITPINPPPKIQFEEFDGLARIVFSRRNKQIRACFFGARGVLDMMEKNWRTWCAEKEQVSMPDRVKAADLWLVLTLQRCSSQPIDSTVSFASIVDKILSESGYAESRAAQLDIDDLLKMLAAFHAEGIHLA